MGGLSASGMGDGKFSVLHLQLFSYGTLHSNPKQNLNKKNGIVTTFHLLSVKLLTFAMKINLLLPFTKEPSFIKLNLQS